MNNDETIIVGEVFAGPFGGWGIKLDVPVNGHSVGPIKLYALDDGTIGWEPADD